MAFLDKDGLTYLWSKLKVLLNNKADSSDLTSHTSNTDIHVTTSDKTNWNSKLSSTLPAGSGLTFETTGTTKGRLFTLQAVPDWVGWTVNAQFTSSGWVLDDPTKYGWFLKLDSRPNLSEYSVYLIPTGAGAHTDEYAVFTVKSDGSCLVNGESVVLASDLTSLENRISALETQILTKQDKIESWGDLAGDSNVD